MADIVSEWPSTPTSSCFAELYRAHFGGLSRMAALLTGSAATGEDLAAEAFVRVMARSHSAHAKELDVPLAYLRKTVLNLSRTHARRQAYARLRMTLLAPAGQAYDTAAEQTFARLLVVAELGRLPRRQREVITLRYFSDLPEHEVADLLNISIGSVKTHASRALATLRQRLEDADGAK